MIQHGPDGEGMLGNHGLTGGLAVNTALGTSVLWGVMLFVTALGATGGTAWGRGKLFCSRP